MFGIKPKNNRHYPSISEKGANGGPDWGKLTTDLKYALDKLPEGELAIQITKVGKFNGHDVVHGTLAVKIHGKIETFPIVSGGMKNGYTPGLVHGTDEVDERYPKERIRPYTVEKIATREDWGCNVVGKLSNPTGTGRGGFYLHILKKSPPGFSSNGITEGCIACPRELSKPFENMIEHSAHKHVYMLPSTTIGGLRYANHFKAKDDRLTHAKEQAKEAAKKASYHSELHPKHLVSQLPRENSLTKYS